MRPEDKLEIIAKSDIGLEKFDVDRIANIIWKAARAVGGEDKELAFERAKEVIDFLLTKYGEQIPSVEEVYDAIEKVLVERGHYKTAKALILERQERELEKKKEGIPVIDAEKLIDNYISQYDWRVRENSNVAYSFPGLALHIIQSVISKYTQVKIYPPEIAKAHVSGDFHIHDLGFGIVGYCAGWSLKQLLYEGFNGVPGRVESKPARHFDTALLQMVNFMGVLQNEWAGAQAFNSVDTLLAPFVRKDKLDYKQVKQNIQKFVYGLNITSRWGGQCVSEDTEILTEEGWKSYKQLKPKEKIATFNLKKKKIEFLPLEKLNVYDYDGYLLNLKSRTQDQLITPNHRVVRRKFSSEDYELIEAEKINFKTNILIPNSGYIDSKKKENKYLIKLLAWIIADGHISKTEGTKIGDRGRISIYQSEKNMENCEEIRECLRKLGLKWDERKRRRGFSKHWVITFRLSQDSSRKIKKYINKKEIPKFLFKLDPELIRLFIETYAKADGHIDRKGRIRLYTKDEKLRDDLQYLCTLCGFGSTLKRRENGVWVINLIRNRDVEITKISKVRYKGKVWCPTTRNSTFIARRKGKVFITGNSPFTNITLDWKVPEDLKEQNVIYAGQILNETYADYQEEMDMINKAFIEVMIEGDMKGRVFTFPIPTYNISRDFDWDDEKTKLLFEMASKYGIPYFANFINSDLKPSDIRSMCCRLRLDLRELRRNVTGGLFGSSDNTGSIGVVTINMPRIGYLSKEESNFFERLENLMELARDSLEIKRKVLNRNLEMGLLPYTKRYLGTFDNHFSTIGLIGMHECCLNFLGVGIETKQGQEFAIKVLKFMRELISEFQEETGNIYNLEATPGEGTSHRLALLDKKEYPNIITSGKSNPYYTNSTQLPVGYTDDPIQAVLHQEPLQVLYTGGTVFHTYFGEKLSSWEVARDWVRKVFSNTRIPYLTITPTFSICPEHGYIQGEHWRCPTCGKECEVYSRVVGYIRPVRNWNAGKQEEFKERKTFSEEKIKAPRLFGQKTLERFAGA